jgi:hypothetical protein
MLKRFASGLAIWTLFVGTCLAFQESPAPANEQLPPPVVSAPAVPKVRADGARVPAVIQQMQALDRHARIGMLCYSGPFAPVKKEALPALALKVKFQLPQR